MISNSEYWPEAQNQFGENSSKVVIVGAGPAGLCAAAFLAEVGVGVTVIDESLQVGGQISRRAHDVEFDPGAYPWARPYKKLLEQSMASPLIEFRQATTVWSIDKVGSETRDSIGFDNEGENLPEQESSAAGPTMFRVNLATEGTKAGSITAEIVLLATGAYDAPLPVAGWTSPGVVGLGALQTIAKTQGLAPADDVAVYGTHPLSLISAAEVVRQGNKVATVTLPQSLGELTVDALRFLLSPVAAAVKLPQLLGALWTLIRAGVPLRFGQNLVRISQGEGQRMLTFQRWGNRGESGRSEIAANVIGIGGGFLASSELLRSIDCETTWDFDRGGWIAQHDESMRTTLENVYVAGELSGVAGAESSASQGVVAGRSIALKLNVRMSPFAEKLSAQSVRSARKWARFGMRMAQFGAAARARLIGDITEETVICRCEAVTVGDVRTTWEKYRSLVGLRDIKMITRLGMGHCQARYCGPMVYQIFPYGFDRPEKEQNGTVPRTPVKPLRVAELNENLQK